MPIKRLGLWFLWICLLPLSCWAGQHDLVVERHWVEDPSGTLTWAQARQQPLRPFQNLLTQGYGAEPLWIRLKMDPKQAAQPLGDPLVVLRIRPAYLDEIQVFDALQSPDQPVTTLGDRYPISHQNEASINFAQELPVGTEPREIWLRVQTSSARLVYPEILTHADFHRSNSQLLTLGALYLGLIVAFIVWGVVQMVLRPEALMGAFLLYQFSAWWVGFCLWGYGFYVFSDVFWPGWVDALTNAGIVVSSGSVLVFSNALLKEMSPSALRSRLIYAAFAIFPMLLLAQALGQVSWSLQINMLLILLLPLMLLVMATASLRRSPLERRRDRRGLPKLTIWTYFALSALFTVLTALPALGVVGGGVYSVYIVFMYSVCSGVLMVLLLQYRAWLALRQQTRLRTVAHQALASAKVEQASREERERLLAMLGHEMKTPLATMRMMLVNPQIPAGMANHMDALISDMAQILERSVQASRLEAGHIDIEVRAIDLVELLSSLPRDLNGLDRIWIQPDAPRRVWINSDPTLLKIIVRNLMENALKYSPPGSDITVEVNWPNDEDRQWSLVVRNAPGKAGMPDPDRVFQKHYRSALASHQAGSGLGLYLISGLVRMLQGELRYTPVPDEVRFELRMKTDLTGVTP